MRLCAIVCVCLMLVGCGGDNGRSKPGSTPDSSKDESGAAYVAVDVANGGTITGRVMFVGERPQLPAFDVISQTDVCAPAARNNRLEVGSGGGVRYAVVALEGVHRGKPMPELPVSALTIDQQGCQYTPHVIAAPVGSLI